MADTVDKSTRSRMMSKIRGKDTRPEIMLRQVLYGIRPGYRLHARDLPGRPDLIYRRIRVAIFVNGCFWHRHQGCPKAYRVKSNTAFWEKKFSGNRKRDQLARETLEKNGWRVITAWECALGNLTQAAHAAEKIDQFIRGTAQMLEIPPYDETLINKP